MISLSAVFIPPMMLLVTGLTAPIVVADCACQCMSGNPRTVCTSLQEAQSGARRCPHNFRCPGLSSKRQNELRDRKRYTAPDKKATNCRDSYFWDPIQQDYVIRAKVCDIKKTVLAPAS